jgi:hypothetical protein
MSEVIARPAKAKSTATKAASKAPAKLEEGKFTRFTIKAAFGILEVLLQSASKTDEPHQWSGDSDRLLALAADLAGTAHTNTPGLDDAQRVAYDIAALIKSAKLVPGDSESAERADLLNQAAVQLNWLTECDETGANCIDIGAARPMVQAQVATPLPSASERKVAATGVSLLEQAIKAVNDEDGAAYAAELLKLGQKILQQASEGVVTEECIRDVFLLAAAVCSGALAIEKHESPDATQRHQLIVTAFEILNNAGLSYDCELYPCADAAAAIEAGARLATQPAPVARHTLVKSEQAPALAKSTERARELTNSAICHLEAAREVLHILAQDNAGDEVHGLVVLVDLLWNRHASTDEAEDIGLPYDGLFADLQRELSVAQAMAALVRTKEEGAMSAVDYLLQDAAQLTEDALNAIPLEAEGP